MDNSALVHTAWDLGSPLNTATWFFQIVGPEIRIVDCDSDLDLTPVQRVARMLAKGYFYGSHFLPHAAQVTQKSGKTFLTELNELGLRNCKAVPQTYDIWIGIKFFGDDCLLCRREPRRIGAIALKSTEKPHFFQIIRHPKKRVGQGGPRLVPNLSSLARLRAGKLCCDPASESGNEFEDRRTRNRSDIDATFSLVFFLESNRIGSPVSSTQLARETEAGTHFNAATSPHDSARDSQARLARTGPIPSRRRRMHAQASWSRGFSSTRRKDLRSLMCAASRNFRPPYLRYGMLRRVNSTSR